MKTSRWLAILELAACALMSAGNPGHAQTSPQQAPGATSQLAPLPEGKETDVKFYDATGKVITGKEAFDKMPSATLVLWLAGNQFFAMDDVVHAFQKGQGGATVGLITLPPGLLLQAIKAGGWTYAGQDYRGRPDVYASVSLGHLKQLKSAGFMDAYIVYMHNELQIMVAKGNPKKVVGISDLARPDLRTSMPNPVNEGIMQFYIRKVLERHGLWQTISGGKECVSCQTTPNNWFTAVHHRETPDRIKAGRSDAGVVWNTEVLAAKRAGADIDAVDLPPEDSLRDEVAYAIGALTNSPHKQAADAFLAFLRSPAGQDAYAKYGFVKASAADLTPKPIN